MYPYRRFTDGGTAVFGFFCVAVSFTVLPLDAAFFAFLFLSGLGAGVGGGLCVIRAKDELDERELSIVNTVIRISGIVAGVGLLFTLLMEQEVPPIFLMGIGMIIFCTVSLIKHLLKEKGKANKGTRDL